MSKSLSVEAPYLNVLYQPTGCPQRAESNQTVKDLQVSSSKPSFKHAWKYSNHRNVICAWQNTALDSACHCFCSSAKHGLSFQTPCAYYKGFKLNLPHNSKRWAMLCSPHLCGGMDRWHQSMLFFSTGTTDVKHKACTPLQGLLVVTGRTHLCNTHKYLDHAHLLQEELQVDKKWQGDTFAVQGETIPRLLEQQVAFTFT